jgi:hypothetical protein
MITLDEAKALKSGQILHTNNGQRWKVNGMVKTWKRDPKRIRVPLKRGLYQYEAITELDFNELGVCTQLTVGEPV